jgi:glycosyltransferase involved in cell wall biosynthesis
MVALLGRRSAGISLEVHADRLKVLVVAANASAKWGGEAILPLHIFQGLRSAGHEAWLCVGRETKTELDELLGPDAERVVYVDDTRMHAIFRWIQDRTPRWMGSNPLYFFQVIVTQIRQRSTVLRLVRTLGIDVVHQPTPVSPKVSSFLPALPVPLVVGPMNGGMEYPPGFRFLQARATRAVRRVTRLAAGLVTRLFDAKRRADCLLVANERTRAALPSGIKVPILEMVENGVVPGVWNHRTDAPVQAAPDRAFELVFIGRLERWKGAEWLVEAVARASRRVDCKLKVVGELRGERRRLATRVRELRIESRVELLGWQPQARCAELLAAADVLVLPSVFECGGAVVLEAMASAKAVIAVDWGGPGDYLDASCGILIAPRDPASLVSDLEEAIVSLATDRDRCVRLGRAGLEKVLAHYTWPMKIERITEVYRQVLRRGATSSRAEHPERPQLLL